MNRKDKKTTTARVQGVLVLKVGLGSDYENSTGIIVGKGEWMRDPSNNPHIDADNPSFYAPRTPLHTPISQEVRV